jgi:serine/threonine protein kinase
MAVESIFESLLLIPQMCSTGDPLAFITSVSLDDDSSTEFEDFVGDEEVNNEDAFYEKLEGFEIKELIGIGSYGKVFRAIHIPTQIVYALKVINKSKVRTRSSASSHLQMELQIIRFLNHQFIAKCHGIIKTDFHIIIVEEFIPGGELYYFIQNCLLTEEQAIFYAAEIVIVLEYLREKGILFRDLKPENIMLDSRGHIKLVDFGLATIKPLQNCTEVFSKTFCGTSEYLAPEMINSHYYGLAVDIWALGCVIFECTTGCPPFYNTNQTVMYNNIRSGQVPFPSRCSSEFKSLINLLLAKDWKLRPTIEEIKKHPWFRKVNWDRVRKKEVRPPLVPKGNETLNQSQSPELLQLRQKSSNVSFKSDVSSFPSM